MYFLVKNILKNNCNHTSKQASNCNTYRRTVHHPLNFNKKKEAHLCQISSIRLEAFVILFMFF